MKPQRQLFSHDPANGVHGDCHRTAIACILGIDAKDVPHFCDTDDMEEALRREREWLAQRGLTHVNWVFPGSLSLEDILSRSRSLATTPMILLGSTKRRVNHSVVVLAGDIVCDPSCGGPNPDALIGPAIGGAEEEWWLTIYAVGQNYNEQPLTYIGRDPLYDGERGIP